LFAVVHGAISTAVEGVLGGWAPGQMGAIEAQSLVARTMRGPHLCRLRPIPRTACQLMYAEMLAGDTYRPVLPSSTPASAGVRPQHAVGGVVPYVGEIVRPRLTRQPSKLAHIGSPSRNWSEPGTLSRRPVYLSYSVST
jgi:hypothetical protein